MTLRLISPALGQPPQSEAQVLGAVIWLLLHSLQHRDLPLSKLASQVLPAVQSGQYILLSEQSDGNTEQNASERPVAWVAWANFSASAEASYLSDHTIGMPVEEWRSGDRMWFIHWVAPFGHTRTLRRLIRDLMPDTCARGLHHRALEHGARVDTYRGKNISTDRARLWWRERPMLAAAPAAPG